MSVKHFLHLGALTKDELDALIILSQRIKHVRHQKSVFSEALVGKTLAMIFERPSTRTRISFEVGMQELGGRVLSLTTQELQLGRGEPLEDTAQVLSRYVDIILLRTSEHARVEALAASSHVPVINGLSDIHHPTQVVADLLTILEHKGKLHDLKIAYIGDAHNNVTHDWLLAAALLGLDFHIAAPEMYGPSPAILQKARSFAASSGARLALTDDPRAALSNADVVITDVWTSMGREEERDIRLKHLKPYQVNEEAMQYAQKDAIFMHCLPAHRGEEVTAAVMDGPQSVVFDEAENRLHAHKAILLWLLSGQNVEAYIQDAVLKDKALI